MTLSHPLHSSTSSWCGTCTATDMTPLCQLSRVTQNHWLTSRDLVMLVAVNVPHQGLSDGHLCSATWTTSVVRRIYSNYGDRCFAAAGPKLWNSLPAELRQDDISFQWFKRLLKTSLFGCWDRSALWLTVKAALYKFSCSLTCTYLLQLCLWLRLLVIIIVQYYY